MSQLGSKGRPATVRVRTMEHAEEIVRLCDERGWQVIVGVEPDKAEDLSDVERLLARGDPPPSVRRAPPRITGNDYCPCRSGLKFKKCCGA